MNKNYKQNGEESEKGRRPIILIVLHSVYGHLSTLAEAVVGGVSIGGGVAVVRQVEELKPKSAWTDAIKSAKKKMGSIKIIDPVEDLKNIDGIILGSPVHFGGASTQMKYFLQQAAGSWSEADLAGKPGAVFIASSTQHGGHEMAMMDMIVALMHFGCVIVGLPMHSHLVGEGLKKINEVSGGAPYGASTITGLMGERVPSRNELVLASALGQRVALTAEKLINGKK